MFLISGKSSIFIKSIGKTAKPNTIKKILNTNLYFVNFLFSNLLAIFLSLKYWIDKRSWAITVKKICIKKEILQKIYLLQMLLKVGYFL